MGLEIQSVSALQVILEKCKALQHLQIGRVPVIVVVVVVVVVVVTVVVVTVVRGYQ